MKKPVPTPKPAPIIQKVTGAEEGPEDEPVYVCPKPVNPDGTHFLEPFGSVPEGRIKKHLLLNIRQQLPEEKDRMELLSYIYTILDPEIRARPIKVPSDMYWWMPVINEAALTGKTCWFRSYTGADEALTTDNRPIRNPTLPWVHERNWNTKMKRLGRSYDEGLKPLGRPLWLVLTEDVDNLVGMDAGFTDQELDRMIESGDHDQLLKAMAWIDPEHPRMEEVWKAFFTPAPGPVRDPQVALAEWEATYREPNRSVLG